MTAMVSTLFKGPPKPEGPSKAEKMLAAQQREDALKDRAEQERLKALAQNARGKRASLTFVDAGANETLG